MTIEKVSYQKTYSIGPYLTERIGFEASLEENDKPHNAITELRHIADRTHEQLNPHLYQESSQHFHGLSPIPENQRPEPIPIIPKDVENPTDTLQAIQDAPDMTTLSSFKLLASKNPDLYKAYCDRLKYLSA